MGGGPDPNNVSDGWVLKDVSGFLSNHGLWSGGVLISATPGTGTIFNFGTTSGFQFERGSLAGTAATGGTTYFFYQIRSRSFSTTTTTTTTNINTGVPTSGQISSNQWYGAETA
jgi:hypothetical protein